MIDTLTIKKSLVSQSRLSELDMNDIQFGSFYSDHMFVADYRDGSWTDCRIVPFDSFKVSPAMSVLHYGQSVFEGLKAYAGSNGEVLVFRAIDNYLRINQSAARMCIPALPEEIFMGGLQELLKTDRAWVPTDEGTSLYIRPFIFATDEFIGVRPSDTYKFIIFTSPAGAYYSEPVKVKVEKYFSRAFPGGTGAAKAAGNYAASLYPAKLAQQEGYHQLMWTDGLTHQYIEESGTMNIMFVVGDKLITSKGGETVLDGITRKSVLQLAREWGYKVEERNVSVAEIIKAIENGSLTEAFGTGTAATIAQIAVISNDGQDYILPAIEGEGRKFSNRVLKELNDIKTGRIEDRYNWNIAI
jgi:branched-chain amino acid aminotransferase